MKSRRRRRNAAVLVRQEPASSSQAEGPGKYRCPKFVPHSAHDQDRANSRGSLTVGALSGVKF